MAVDVESAGETAFTLAAKSDQDEIVRALIEAGAAPDQRLDNGRTMLMRVATRASEDLRMIEFLLDHRADAKAVDGSGMTPLMVAAYMGNVDGVRRLALLDVRSLDKSLMLASARGFTHCMEALIERGAYVNCRSHDQQTPLMYAAGKGHMEAVQVLLRHHANRFAVDESGETATELAEKGGFAALAVVLRDTSSLIAPAIPANNEFLPSLNGQLIAFLSAPVEAEDVNLLDPIEPDRPLVERPVDDEPREDQSTQDGPDRASAKPVLKPGKVIGTSASVNPKKFDLKNEIRLGRYEERFEAILVTSVTGDKAKVHLLDRPVEDAMITVMVGERIPGTSYEVTRMTTRVRPAKGGGTVDVTEVFVRKGQSSEEQRFVRGTLPRDEETHLVVETTRSQQRFAARMGDVFTSAETQEAYTVTDVRPHQLLVRNESTQEIFTIERS